MLDKIETSIFYHSRHGGVQSYNPELVRKVLHSHSNVNLHQHFVNLRNTGAVVFTDFRAVLLATINDIEADRRQHSKFMEYFASR
jgi:hypothetical protein